MTLLRTEGLTKAFGDLIAVDNVDLMVESGTIHSIIGPNGAGKSTLFNLITGLYQPTDGEVYFKDNSITGKAPHDIARSGIARSFQESDVFLGMTVKESVEVAARATKDQRRSMRIPADQLIENDENIATTISSVGLADQAAKPARDLSHGDRRKLEIALTVVNEPDLLLLDEPTSGMGEQDSIEIVNKIRQLATDRNITIIMIEHDISIVMENSDLVTVLHNGQIIARGSPQSVQEDDTVKQAYLGVGDETSTLDNLNSSKRGPDSVASVDQAENFPEQSHPVLLLDGVQAAYGQSQVLTDVSLSVSKGEVVSLLGRNGVGKTTILRTIAGILKPMEGEILFNEQTLAGLADFQRVKRGISYVPEDRQIFPELTVEENLKIGQFSGDQGVLNREEVFERFPRLDERRENLGSQLSGGEQQMLAIARALIGPTRLLLLDEPTEGLAPQIVEEVIDIIQQIQSEEGITTLMVEQNVHAALTVADRHHILHDGHIAFEGTTPELLEAEDIIDRYLGLGADL